MNPQRSSKRLHITTLIFSTLLALSACGGGSSGSGAPTPSRPSTDSTPNAFTLTDQTDSMLGVNVISNSITVSGINTSANISITGGEYAIDGGAYTSAASTVNNGQTVTVRLTTSANVSTAAEATLTIGGVSDTFNITTVATALGGLYSGTGSANGGSNNLTDVKTIFYNDRFMAFDVGNNVLYDGRIQTYNSVDGSFTASVTVYKDGVNNQQANASGTFVASTSLSVVFTGTAWGSGTLTLTYDALYERDATLARFTAEFLNGWLGTINTMSSGTNMALQTPLGVTDNTFIGGTNNPANCNYDTATKMIPDSTVNVYQVAFNATQAVGCNHIGTGYTGLSTIIDGGTRGTDGIMWFAASNGTHSNFSILAYQ